MRRNQANFLSLFVLSPLTPKPMKIKIREATDDKEAYANLLLRVVGSFMSQLSSEGLQTPPGPSKRLTSSKPLALFTLREGNPPRRTILAPSNLNMRRETKLAKSM